MARFSEYADKFETIGLERRGGILQMTLHSGGGSLQWGPTVQSELVDAFTAIGADRENRVIILTGTGDAFSGLRAEPGKSFYRELSAPITADLLDRTHWTAKRVMTRMLDVEVPMIAAVNGPAMRHSEIALMCDIVLASEQATFEDTAHFDIASQVPGDGINIVYTMLLGLNRARYFMLTGQVLSAAEAKDLGLVAEVLPRDRLLPRAWELAEKISQKNDLLLRYTRVVMTEPLRKWMEESVMYHLALEALAKLDKEEVLSDDEEIAATSGPAES